MNAVKSKQFVSVDGPFANSDTEWEFPEWTVLITDDDGEEYKCYTCRSYDAAIALGKNISRDRRIELVVDATRA